VSGNREHDKRTGRPRVGPYEAVASLSDRELEQELPTAAVAPDHLRFDRFARLLRERDRRARREELVLVVASGPARERAAFTGELARLLGAAHLRQDVVPGLDVMAALADLNLRSGISVLADGEDAAELDEALAPVLRHHPDLPVVHVQASELSTPVARLADAVWARARDGVSKW
jgi:hypothetical protein